MLSRMFRLGVTLRRLPIFACVLLVAVADAGPARFAFTVNGLDFSLSRYQVEADGRMRHLGHIPLRKSPPAVVMHPSGRFVLAISKAENLISVFRLDPTSGDLAPVPDSPFETGARSPFDIVFHPSGRFVYVAARFGGVSAYAFDAKSGVLRALPGSPFKAQKRTRSVAMHPSGRFIYAVNGYSNSVSAYTIDPQSGVLHEMPDSPFTVAKIDAIDYRALKMADVPAGAGGIPYHMALDPAGRFAFVVNWAAASISVFRIDPDSGHLTAVVDSPFFTGFNPYSITVHPSGRFVYVSQWSTSEIAVHALDSTTGRLSPVPGSPFTTGGTGPVALVFNTDGSQAYVPNYESNDVALLDVDITTGILRLRETIKTRSGPWDLVLAAGEPVAPSPPWLVVARDAAGLAIFALAEEGLGKGERDNISVRAMANTGGAARVVAVRPDGRFAYAADTDGNTLTTLRMGSSGFSAVADGTVATGRRPVAMAIDVNGWYLYAVNRDDDTLMAWYLDPDSGIPRPVQRAPVRTGRRPVAVTLDPAARYVFVVNAGSNDISVFRYLTSTMPLLIDSRKHGSPFAAGKEPVALAVEPNGHYAYVANAASNDISAYRIQHQVGALSALPGSPFKTAKRPVDLTVHPSGRWLFVANRDASQVSIHAIEKGLGALALAARELELPVPPGALRLSPEGDILWVLSEDGRRLLRLAVEGTTGGLTLLSDESLEQPIVDLAVVAGLRR